MKILVTLLLPILVSLLACEERVEPVRTFTMKKGEHYSTPRIVESLQSNQLRFKARFNTSAIYSFNDRALQDCKNKLLGFADCNSLHHENSARFSWQWFDNRLEIHAYCYVNRQRVEFFIGEVAIDQWNDYSITVTDSTYVFQLNNNEPMEIQRGSTCSRGAYYILWPYFGGSSPAPHDVSLDIIQKY